MEGKAIFVTGIGTGIGKTVSAAILTEALGADYWKPIQAGTEEGTDTERVRSLVSNGNSRFHEECYTLTIPASPHLAARIDNVKVTLQAIRSAFDNIRTPERHLVVEGAGGLMVPLNESDFFPDLIKMLGIPVVVVASQYLGNINHSLMTAECLKNRQIPVLGWIFNGTYHVNEEDIIRWSGFEKIGRIEEEEEISPRVIKHYAEKIRPRLLELLG
ncbi:dethiobiotin synthase [Compostibacter hankyongensis]|uniref:ATP-dependent dethiobiotin synthetase BioD n=1 Tax=Compostibacter hankyongensis TaxID=1007089 RepID=A0ABP8G604_9BACT